MIAAALAGAAAAPASSATLTRCGAKTDVRCGRITVPLDYAGSMSGSLHLWVQRLPAPTRRQPRTAVVALAGGPGQAAVPFMSGFSEELAPALRQRDLVVFDQRGTGRSGVLECPELQRADVRGDLGGATARCARRLGPRRAFYTTHESVEDIERIRRALGYERLLIYGVSYGTRVAEAYAIAHPGRVEKLILDSVVPPEGPDAFDRSSFVAVRRILRALCAAHRCRAITPDVEADVARLVARASRHEPVGAIYDGRGRRHRRSLSDVDLLLILIDGDFDRLLRLDFPAGVRSALRGDPAPILRLAELARRGEAPGPARELSAALYTATICEELAFPWPRGASPGARLRSAQQAAAAIPTGLLYPFTARTALRADNIGPCAGWPSAPRAPILPAGPLPDVPALVLAGGDDLRTPLEDGRRVAALLPQSQFLVVPGVGHGVVGNGECADRALASFLRGRRVASCRVPLPPPLPSDISPVSLRQVAPIRAVGGRPGRTLAAVALTVLDTASHASFPRTGGLRGGWLHFDGSVLRLRRLVYVPGVSVSGRIAAEATLVVGGRQAARGTLHIDRRGMATGRLGGRRVRTRALRSLVAFTGASAEASAASGQRSEPRPRIR